VHLPLVVPGDGGADAAGRPRCRLRVGAETRAWREGRALVFDDSHQHEAWHDEVEGGGSEARVVLIVDVWHPDLSDEEVRFLSFVRAAQMRRAKAMSEARGVPRALNFFAVLADARRIGADDSNVFGGAESAAGGGGGGGGGGESGGESGGSGGSDGEAPPPLPHGAVEARDD